MKRNIIAVIILALILPAGACLAQDIPHGSLPSLITTAFKQNFPEASDVEWELDAKGYKAEFNTGWFTNDQEVWFDETGNLLKKTEEISKSQLPQAISSSIRSGYPSYKIDDVEKITEEGSTFYAVELEGEENELDLIFDSQGNEVK